MMKTIKCPNCNEEAELSGRVSCWCDKDFCNGQRCGADRLYAHYKCSHCGAEGEPEDTKNYYSRHMPKD